MQAVPEQVAPQEILGGFLVKEHPACCSSLEDGDDLELRLPAPDLGNCVVSCQDFVRASAAKLKPSGSLQQQPCGCTGPAVPRAALWSVQRTAHESTRRGESVALQVCGYFFNLSCLVIK